MNLEHPFRDSVQQQQQHLPQQLPFSSNDTSELQGFQPQLQQLPSDGLPSPLTRLAMQQRRRATGSKRASTPGRVETRNQRHHRSLTRKPLEHAIKALELLRSKVHGQFKPQRGKIDPRVLKTVGNSYEILRVPRNASLTFMLRKYVRDIRAYYKRSRLTFCPSMIAAVLQTQFAPSTAHQYMIHIQSHVNKRFRHNLAWKSMLTVANQMTQLYPAKQAIPTTPEIIQNLIGDLKDPCQKAIFQLYTTASRHAESRPPRQENGLPNLNVWKPSWYPREKMVRLFLKTHKAATKGQRPYSKWIKVNNNNHARLYLKPHNVDYFKLLDYIKQRYPNLSVHSIRRGAIQRLEFLKFKPTEISVLSGHSNKTKIPTMNRTYSANSPHHRDAVLAAKLCMALSNEVLPKRLRSSH